MKLFLVVVIVPLSILVVKKTFLKQLQCKTSKAKSTPFILSKNMFQLYNYNQ